MKNKRLLDIAGEIDDRYIAEAAPAAKRSRPVWLKWAAAAACLCIVAAGAVSLFGKSGTNTVQSWNVGYTGKDYFKYCDTANGDLAAEAVLDESAIPYDDTRYFSDNRDELEANGVIPEIETHPLFSFVARYKDDSLYCVELMWCRRSAKGLDNYSDLKVIAGYEEVPILNDCIFIETDENGKVLEPAVTVTERDGVKIVARGRKSTEKTLTFRNENGWYQLSGSWNDSFDAVAELLDWFWEHPIDFTKYPMSEGDNYFSRTLSETPEAFKEYLPDFASFGFVEEESYVLLKNGTPVRFEGHYVAHADAEKVKNQEYYGEEGYTLMHWCVFAEPDVYDLEGCLGDINSLTKEQISDILENEDNKLKFMQDGLLIIVYPDSADEAWELIGSLQVK